MTMQSRKPGNSAGSGHACAVAIGENLPSLDTRPRQASKTKSDKKLELRFAKCISTLHRLSSRYTTEFFSSKSAFNNVQAHMDALNRLGHGRTV